MRIRNECPDCHKMWGERDVNSALAARLDRLGLTIIISCCPECHQKRRNKLAERAAMYPSSDELGLIGSRGDISPAFYHRPHSSGRRIMHKSEFVAG